MGISVYMFYLAKTPVLIQWLWPGFIWKMPTREKVLYLTFDDGPIPEVTPWVLDTLRTAGAKATFFCVGDNVRKHPQVYKRLLSEGHGVGNHTFNHLNGIKTADADYLENVGRCADWVSSRLFRPPYGRLRKAQRAALQQHYKIVLWDVLSGDFDASISSEQCLRNITRHARPGSVVVLHDSLKAQRHLQFVLPRLLAYFQERGYRFEAISL